MLPSFYLGTLFTFKYVLKKNNDHKITKNKTYCVAIVPKSVFKKIAIINSEKKSIGINKRIFLGLVLTCITIAKTVTVKDKRVTK